MDPGKTERTNLRVSRGLFFMVVGIGLAIVLILLAISLRERVENDFTQHISSIGTKFTVAEDLFSETRKMLLERNVIPSEKLDQLTLMYEDVNTDFTDLKNNIFIAKEEGNSIDESLALIKARRNQVGLLRSGSSIVDNEKKLQDILKQFDECINKVNYEDSPEKVHLSVTSCIDLLKNGKQLAATMEKAEAFTCEQENIPSIYLAQLESTYSPLANYYDSVAKKDYVAVDKYDKEFKAQREQLNTKKPINYCVTKSLEDIGKRIQ